MTVLNRKMLIIQSMDPDSHVGFSPFTMDWYVHCGADLGGDGFTSSISGRGATPEEAVDAMYEALIAVDEATAYKDKNYPHGKYLVVRRGGVQRHYRWNGAAFVELIHSYGKED